MGQHQFTARDLRALIIPLIADSFLSILIGMADTIMVSGCGEAAVSGVSLVDSISNLLITVFSAFATGGAVVVSQYLGRKENDNAKRSAVNLIINGHVHSDDSRNHAIQRLHYFSSLRYD